MEDRLEIWLELLAGKLDRLIELGENVERASRLHEMLEDSGGRQADHFAGADKMVADEPPKKWRILEPGEVVCSSDFVNAKSNLPSDPPNGFGWRPVDASVGTTVYKDEGCIFARPVTEEPAKEPAEHLAGPKPEPGEGYRILSKDPPEELQPNDEYELSPRRWVKSENARTTRMQDPAIWYRRKIEVAKEPVPAWEPKVGDWVRVTRPENWEMSAFHSWSPVMDKFNGKVGKIEGEWEGRFHICGFAWPNGLRFIFDRDWLTPAEPPASEKPAEPEYREPVLPADAGKVCEFSDDGQSWLSGWVYGWMPGRNWVTLHNNSRKRARIKKDA